MKKGFVVVIAIVVVTVAAAVMVRRVAAAAETFVDPAATAVCPFEDDVYDSHSHRCCRRVGDMGNGAGVEDACVDPATAPFGAPAPRPGEGACPFGSSWGWGPRRAGLCCRDSDPEQCAPPRRF